jgi:hypothetical protein
MSQRWCLCLVLCVALQDETAGAAARNAAEQSDSLFVAVTSAIADQCMCLVPYDDFTLQDESAGAAAPGAAELSAMSKLAGPDGAASLAARRKALTQLR